MDKTISIHSTLSPNKILIFKDKINRVEYIFKIFYFLIFMIISIKILSFSYSAWLYPIRTNQYFDECSYLSMGKFFRTIPPIDIIKNHIVKNKPLPNIYNEFDCRLIYWSILLSFPLTITEDRVELHQFRTIVMMIGTLAILILLYKLTGIIGAVIAAAFWIGTPILNYWGHFFMTESPSFVFLIIGYLFLLYSDKIGIASFIGGIFLGIAGLTRFTTIILIFPAPFIILAVYFKPIKRSNFQLFGELSKAFSGILLAIIPYLIFTGWLLENPILPFFNTKDSVNNFAVNDPFYYIKNLWIEGGGFFKLGVLLSLFSPIILASALTINAIIKNNQQQNNNISIRKEINKKQIQFNLSKFFVFNAVYYGLIIFSLLLCSSLYLFYITDIPHKIPRYLMGAIIPLIIVSSLGYGAVESLLINLFRYIGNSFLIYKKKYTQNKIFIKKNIFIIIWTICFMGSTALFANISWVIWNKTMNRPFNLSPYEIPDEVKKTLINQNDYTSLERLQPEYISWEQNINERLKNIKDSTNDGIDNTEFYPKQLRDVLKYLTNIIKIDEVFYVDTLNYTPYTPAYSEVPCVFIKDTYNVSINKLINSESLLYKGYVLVSNDALQDMEREDDKLYIRSLNKISILASNKFKFVANFGSLDLYYFTEGIPFPYQFGTKERLKFLNSKTASEITPTREIPDEKNNFYNKIINSWQILLK